MEAFQGLILGLFENLKPSQIKSINSPIGVIELLCDLVEEAYYRVKKSDLNINSDTKRKLVISLLPIITEKLFSEGHIDERIFNKTMEYLDEEKIKDLEDTINDIITIWNDAKILVERCCGCWRFKRHISRKFQSLSSSRKMLVSSV